MVIAILPTSDAKVDVPRQQLTLIVLWASILSGIGGFLFGYDTGIVSGSMVFIRDDFKLSTVWQEITVSATIIAAWIFSMASGSLADRYGRKKLVTGSALIFVVGSLVMSAALEKWTLLIGRFVVGIATGFASAIVPLYIAELAPPHIRGSLVVVYFLLIVSGQLFAAIIAGAFSYLDEQLGWRFMVGLAALPATLQFVGFLFMPESPRWLIGQKRFDEAIEVLQALRGDNDVEAEFDEIRKDCEEDGESGRNLIQIIVEVLKDDKLRRALLIGTLMWIFHQLTGINTVMYYTATIMQMTGIYDTTSAVWWAAAVDAIYVACSAFGIYLVEKIGRRQLTLWSLAGCVVGLTIMGIGFLIGQVNSPEVAEPSKSIFDSVCTEFADCNSCANSKFCGFCFFENEDAQTSPNQFQSVQSSQNRGSCLFANPEDERKSSLVGLCMNGTRSLETHQLIWAKSWCPSSQSWLIIVGLTIFLASFGPGIGPTPMAVNSEIYPLWCRSACFGLTASICWFFNVLISLSFLSLTEVITKAGTFFLYATFSLLGFIVLFVMLPETKGRTLEETEMIFAKFDKSDVRKHQRSVSLAGDFAVTKFIEEEANGNQA